MKYLTIVLNGFVLLVIMYSTTSCKGQANNDLPKDSVIESGASTNGESKIIKAANAKNNNVHCAIRDKEGNLWFGTTGQGAYRYDGKTFTHFTAEDGLGSNTVSAILQDKNTGDIWFCTNAGIYRYDGKKFFNMPIGDYAGNFIKTYKPTTDAKNPPSKIAGWSIMQDRSGKIWFGTFDDGVYYYDGKKMNHFLHNNSVINKDKLHLGAVNTIIEDKYGNIWFSTWFDGLCRFDGKEIISFKPNGEVWYGGILEDKDGKIWIGRRQHGLIVYDGKKFTNISQGGTLDSCGVDPLLQDKFGKIWFGSIHRNMTLRATLGGLWSYDGKAFKNYKAKEGLDNNSIWSAVEDNDGNLWFGATNTGLYKYDGNSFKSFAE